MLTSRSGTGYASAPAYLKTPKGTIALIASASGLIAPGGHATAERPGVNELRVNAGDRENEATDDQNEATDDQNEPPENDNDTNDDQNETD